MKKVGETTRPFRYNLNQIPYDYTVKVRNRLKGLDLIVRVPDELWTEVCNIVQETRTHGKNSLDVPDVPEARKADSLTQSLRKSGSSESAS